jgi:hypothetical protein
LEKPRIGLDSMPGGRGEAVAACFERRLTCHEASPLR